MSVIEINENEFEERIKNSKNNKVLVDCYATWCGPCKMLAPVIDELAEEITTCDFYKIDIDNAPSIAMKYNIMSIPTLLIFENNELKQTLVGLRPKDELKKIIEA